MTTDKQKPLYVASRASVPERPALWRFLRANGWPIISTWIDEAGPGETASMSELWERIAGEVSQACGVVAFVDPSRDLPLKGALVEVGMALGQGKRVGLVCLSAEHPDTARRLGSWVEHPAVLVCDDFHLAREWVQAAPGRPESSDVATGPAGASLGLSLRLMAESFQHRADDCGRLARAILEDVERQEARPEWSRDDRASSDLLCLVGYTAHPDVLATWSDETMRQVDEWASATHLRASDNDGVTVPPRPAVLKGEPWRGEPDEWGDGPTIVGAT